MSERNQVVVSGRLIEVAPVRYTPAGIPAIEFKIAHESQQLEAGIERQVRCEIPCVCLGEPATAIAKYAVDEEIVVKGFFAARSRRWLSSLVLHVTRHARP
ncbi:primosomal replication protein N [Chitinimonas lacunae]|uniref:Replication restart protein PriB n=1 Tax=Chitinimonas lacunae TaxID=1963018 RepID=A0ABV8MMY2_9NEIS